MALSIPHLASFYTLAMSPTETITCSTLALPLRLSCLASCYRTSVFATDYHSVLLGTVGLCSSSLQTRFVHIYQHFLYHNIFNLDPNNVGIYAERVSARMTNITLPCRGVLSGRVMIVILADTL